MFTNVTKMSRVGSRGGSSALTVPNGTNGTNITTRTRQDKRSESSLFAGLDRKLNRHYLDSLDAIGLQYLLHVAIELL